VNTLRKILYPFSFLYGGIITARNKAFDKGIITSIKFDIPTIVVGNLNVGGTGKSPQIEYLVRLLQQKYKIAILSRGYKRKSKGFQLANKNATAQQIGDEPMQFYKKFQDILVVVDGDRVNGINQLKNTKPIPDVILLDDAFQHRKVNAGLNILLTAYDDLYVNDVMLPTGNLREKKEGAKRAQVIIVSKCPKKLDKKQQNKIVEKLNIVPSQFVFFSTIGYNNVVLNQENKKIEISKLEEYKVLLVTGIANANPLLKHLTSKNVEYQHITYADHYNFTETDKKEILDIFENIKADKKIILTTEKDYVRAFSHLSNPIYYLPIQTEFLDNEEDFNKLILDYVQQNTRNS